MADESSFSGKYLAEVAEVAIKLDPKKVEKVVDMLATVRKDHGRLFILGVGGSAANASHAVNDFRKLAGIESYAPTDNVSELTARTNDEGWANVFGPWLATSHLGKKDAVLVLSVGGGDEERQISVNLVAALKHARSAGAKVLGIVGRENGFTAQNADVCIVIPTVNPSHVTPHSESFQEVIWHLLVFHPKLKLVPSKWESVK